MEGGGVQAPCALGVTGRKLMMVRGRYAGPAAITRPKLVDRLRSGRLMACKKGGERRPLPRDVPWASLGGAQRAAYRSYESHAPTNKATWSCGEAFAPWLISSQSRAERV